MLRAYSGPFYSQITLMMARMNGNVEEREVAPGYYAIGHCNLDNILETQGILKERWPDIAGLHSYGVCDSPEQFIRKYGKKLQADSRSFIVSFCRMEKAKQSAEGGWRWHKWGPYVGKQKPTCEYLYDEPKIEEVYVFHVYEVTP